MHWIRQGRGEPPLVFVHGILCSLDDWRLQLEGLQEAHEVIACDLRGHGATPGGADVCSIEIYGGDVAALLRDLGLSNAILIGHSMGCRVVLEAARRAPERVAGLVLIDGSRLANGDPAAAQAALGARIDQSGYRAYAQDIFRQMFLHSSAQSEAIIARALNRPDEIGRALWARLARWDASEMDAVLAAVRVPLLAIQSTGRNSQGQRVMLKAGDTSSWLDLVKEKVPAAALEIIGGVGHFTQLEADANVNRLIARFASGCR